MIGCSILRRHREQAVAAMNEAMEPPRDERRAAKAIVVAGLALASRFRADDFARKTVLVSFMDDMRQVARSRD